MPRLSPFAGLFFDEAVVGPLSAVTAPPYDTVSADQRRRLLDSSPYNVVRLDMAEAHTGDADHSKYTRAASLLSSWRDEGALRVAPSAGFGIYEMRFRFEGEPRRILGLICQVEIEAWGGRIVPHERTMLGTVEDRLRLIRSLRADLSPIYALYPGPREVLTSHLTDVAGAPSGHELVDEAGVQHRLWISQDVPDLPQDDPLLIADGHHRYTTALRYRDEMRAAHGPGPWDHTMMFLVDASTERPPVLPIHRVLTSSASIPRGERVRDLEELRASLDDAEVTYGIVSREAGLVVHEVGRLDAPPPTVCALHDQIASLDEPHGLRFTHDAVDAENAVRSGRAAMAILLPPTTAERIRSVVDAGERMPEKSTFFWPKPRTGMVLRSMGEPDRRRVSEAPGADDA